MGIIHSASFVKQAKPQRRTTFGMSGCPGLSKTSTDATEALSASIEVDIGHSDHGGDSTNGHCLPGVVCGHRP
jgi:hypothetical protein